MGHRTLLRRCAAFLPIGQASRDFYRSYEVAEDRLFDAPYFVDNDRFIRSAAQARPRRRELRERWGIPPGAVCFCYAGKLEPKKRILDLLAALRVASGRAQRPVHLLVVGTGELLEEARAYSAAHALPVTFAGFLNQSEIPSAYVASDCLALPSDYGETWGLVVNEAMACERPALVSDRVGCAHDLVIPDKTGSVFPFGDIEQLAARMLDLASEPERLARMGSEAHNHVTTNHSVERSVLATVAAVERALSTR